VIDVPSVGLGAAVEPVAPERLSERSAPFAALPGWADADHEPALAAFKRSCPRLLKKSQTKAVQSNRPAFGTYADWVDVCRAAALATNAAPFFESLFLPVSVSNESGLLTGYYEPEVAVRAKPDAIFSEPIHALPQSAATRKLPRSQLTAKSAPVIA
jgi:membrane-bound lytic murein transglycosylase A